MIRDYIRIVSVQGALFGPPGQGIAHVKVKNFRTKLGVVDSGTEAMWREHGVAWSYEDGDPGWWLKEPPRPCSTRYWVPRG